MKSVISVLLSVGVSGTAAWSSAAEGAYIHAAGVDGWAAAHHGRDRPAGPLPDADFGQKSYAAEELVPIEGVVPNAWAEAIADAETGIERIPYELCVLIALSEPLRRRRSMSRAPAGGGIRTRTC